MDVLGVDIAKLTFDATLLTSSGSHHHHSFANTPDGFAALDTWLADHQVSHLHACMEATNVYWHALGVWLHARAYTVSVVNPARIKGCAQATMQRNKTDKLDSAIIASFCKTHRPDPWQPLSDEQQRLRALLRHRDDLLHTHRQQHNRLGDATDQLVRNSLQTLLKAIAEELAAVERSIKEHLQACAQLQADVTLLTTVVGIGLVTATKMLGEFGDLAHYDNAKAAAADAGLTPSHFESGTSVRRRPKLSKIGKAGIRAALYWPAITAMRQCPAIKAFAEQLAKRGKAKKVIIGAVMRKLVHSCYGVLKNRTPYDPDKVSALTAPST